MLRFSASHVGALRWVLATASAVTAVSDDLMRKAAAMAPLRGARVVPNAFDPDGYAISPRVGAAGPALARTAAAARRARDGGAVIVGTLAQLRSVKGIEVLLEAFASLLGRTAEARLLLVGGFETERADREFRRFLRGSPLAGRVWLTGPVPPEDVLGWLGCMDVFAFPSLAEGCPNSVLEAMACGLPIVASRVGGVPDLVEEGVTGRLVPPADAGALMRSLAELVREPARRKELGDAGRRRVLDEFTPEREARAWIEVYRSAMADPIADLASRCVQEVP